MNVLHSGNCNCFVCNPAQRPELDSFPPIEACSGIAKDYAGIPPTFKGFVNKPPSPNLPHAKSAFDTAYALIGGDRREAYGAYTEEAGHVAAAWNAILKGGPVTARKVPLLMTALKLVREATSPKGDNIVDACGYLGLLAELNALESNDATSQNPSANAFTGQD